MKAHHKRRLLKLADFLSKLPRDRFDYGAWVGSDWEGKQTLSCGTKACALGWAATMPEFRRLGLRLGRQEGVNTGIVIHKPTGLEGYAAAQEIFGSYKGINSLFHPEYSEELATPKQVARKIRDFVERDPDPSGWSHY